MNLCTNCIHSAACQAWIQHGKMLYDDFEYFTGNCPHFINAGLNELVAKDTYKKVVHGRWIEDTERYIFGRKKNDICSNCRTSSGIIKFNYCPNCGAKMDLERKGMDGV